MKNIAEEIRKTVDEAEPALSAMDPDQVSRKPDPAKWSKKEILGHLVDSAANNHQRFVRGACNAASDFPPYSQDDWVRVQQYNRSDWSLLAAFWAAYNRHLSDIIERVPEAARTFPCNIGREEPVSLEFVIMDYLRHLKHHVSQLLEERE